MNRFHSCAIVSETERRLSVFHGIGKPVVAVDIRKELHVLPELIRDTEFEEGGYLVGDGDRVVIVEILLAVEPVPINLMQVQSPDTIVALMLYISTERGTAHHRDAILGADFHIETQQVCDGIDEVESERYLYQVNILLVLQRVDKGKMVIFLPLRVGDTFPLCRAREGGRGTVVREISAYAQSDIRCEEERVPHMHLCAPAAGIRPVHICLVRLHFVA